MKNKMRHYHPPQEILVKYADVLVNFALGNGKGIKKGDTVVVRMNEYAKPLYFEIIKAIWKAGGHAVSWFTPDSDPGFNLDRHFYEKAKDHQLEFFPAKYMRGLVDQADHLLMIIADVDMHALEGIDPKKIMKRGVAYKPYMEWRREKENKRKLSWTLAMYGTPAMAVEAGLSQEAYWDQIIEACFLREKNPISTWKRVYKDLEYYRQALTKLKIEKVHIKGPDVDLWIAIGKDRQWLGGGGNNIPSFELFTSPDWRGTEGWIRFNQPLYSHGNLIEGIELQFERGKIIRSKATANHSVLKHMIASPHADRVGEFSLTDRRFSKITRFMAETLYDENMGGPEGNTHIAIGAAYQECYVKKPARLKKRDWEKLGFNDSPVHTDIISTSPRVVTAYLPDGTTKVIYKNGQFTL